MSNFDEQVCALVKQIPRGKVASYGTVGRSVEPSISGRTVGRIMARVPEGVPWWRVVAKTGALPIEKIDPNLASEQQTRLEQEGILVDNGIVLPAYFLDSI